MGPEPTCGAAAGRSRRWPGVRGPGRAPVARVADVARGSAGKDGDEATAPDRERAPRDHRLQPLVDEDERAVRCLGVTRRVGARSSRTAVIAAASRFVDRCIGCCTGQRIVRRMRLTGAGWWRTPNSRRRTAAPRTVGHTAPLNPYASAPWARRSGRAARCASVSLGAVRPQGRRRSASQPPSHGSRPGRRQSRSRAPLCSCRSQARSRRPSCPSRGGASIGGGIVVVMHLRDQLHAPPFRPARSGQERIRHTALVTPGVCASDAVRR